MRIIDWFIIAVIVVLFILAVRYSWKNRGKCSGNCSACKHCSSCQNKDSFHK